MTVTVNFEAPQLKVDNGTTGVEISQVILPYSLRNNEDSSQYLGGQTVLTKEDNVAFSDNTTDWYKKALIKIKDMVAVSEIYTPDVDPVVDAHDASSESAPDVTPATQETNAPDIAPVAQSAAAPDVTQPTQETANPDVVTTAQVQQ